MSLLITRSCKLFLIIGLIIVRHTNTEINEAREKMGRAVTEDTAGTFGCVEQQELLALLGLLYLMGLHKSSHVNPSDLWKTDSSSKPYTCKAKR